MNNVAQIATAVGSENNLVEACFENQEFMEFFREKWAELIKKSTYYQGHYDAVEYLRYQMECGDRFDFIPEDEWNAALNEGDGDETLYAEYEDQIILDLADLLAEETELELPKCRSRRGLKKAAEQLSGRFGDYLEKEQQELAEEIYEAMVETVDRLQGAA